MARRSRRYSYGDLRDLIRWSLEDCPGFGSRVEVDGKINRIAEGIWHDNYWFWIRGRDLPGAQTEQAYVLRILEQREDWHEGPEPRDRLIREAETLRVLEKSDFAHLRPRRRIRTDRNDRDRFTRVFSGPIQGPVNIETYQPCRREHSSP